MYHTKVLKTILHRPIRKSRYIIEHFTDKKLYYEDILVCNIYT